MYLLSRVTAFSDVSLQSCAQAQVSFFAVAEQLVHDYSTDPIVIDRRAKMEAIYYVISNYNFI
jgi:hypothetical protein